MTLQGEGVPVGTGPAQNQISQQGDAYLDQFPKLTRILDIRELEGGP